MPQGSVLGPILFVLFVNDITNCLPPNTASKLFADDLKSYMMLSGEVGNMNFSLLLECISKWSMSWQLPLSASKCGWMLISNRSRPHDLSFKLNGEILQELKEVKDLGVIYNSRLNFSNHISSIVSKAKQRLYLLRKSFTYSDSRVLIQAFKTYVLPILDYCSPVWSPSSIVDIIKVESVQRAFTRSLNICHGLNYHDRLIKCDLISLEKRRLIADLFMFYKIVHKLAYSLLAKWCYYTRVELNRWKLFKNGYQRG